MKRHSCLYILIILFSGLLFSSCGTTPYRFTDAPPVTQLDDSRPILVPAPTVQDDLTRLYKIFVRRPAVSLLDAGPISRSKDVNALDDVPASTWYTPRLGYREVTEQELLKGPSRFGPPQFPLRIIKAKKVGTTPGFITRDNRNIEYLIKFDPPDFYGLETATNQVVNRLFWGFGYNVPEDHLIELTRKDLILDAVCGLKPGDLSDILKMAAVSPRGIYRATASRWLDGIILGPTPDKSLREDDPNDRIRHENLRILRALRIFGAFTNYSELEADNFLDIYVGKPGQGHVKHYMLDFGGALGSFGAFNEQFWDGYAHIFSFGALVKNFFTLGLLTEDWANRQMTQWPSVGAFKADNCRPDVWKERFPYAPVRIAQPADLYWGAKIIGALTRDHIETLVDAALYPDRAASAHMVETLMARRERVLTYAFSQVAPIEAASCQGRILTVIDMGKRLLSEVPQTLYEIQFYNDRNRKVVPSYQIQTELDFLEIPIPDLALHLKQQYLRIDVRVKRGNVWLPTPAEFHLRMRDDGTIRLVGMVH